MLIDIKTYQRTSTNISDKNKKPANIKRYVQIPMSIHIYQQRSATSKNIDMFLAGLLDFINERTSEPKAKIKLCYGAFHVYLNGNKVCQYIEGILLISTLCFSVFLKGETTNLMIWGYTFGYTFHFHRVFLLYFGSGGQIL